mmetsp:Transcript_9087/g.14379  ORF Transcript_9087/g.14379 Transcript_9087/m.14379 type:complete len:120 (+) Transcript_9087:1814-2173(+)
MIRSSAVHLGSPQQVSKTQGSWGHFLASNLPVQLVLAVILVSNSLEQLAGVESRAQGVVLRVQEAEQVEYQAQEVGLRVQEVVAQVQAATLGAFPESVAGSSSTQVASTLESSASNSFL